MSLLLTQLCIESNLFCNSNRPGKGQKAFQKLRCDENSQAGPGRAEQTGIMRETMPLERTPPFREALAMRNFASLELGAWMRPYMHYVIVGIILYV